MSIRWNCPYCKAEGWEQGTEKVSPRFDHDRPDGRRCRAAERARVAGIPACHLDVPPAGSSRYTDG